MQQSFNKKQFQVIPDRTVAIAALVIPAINLCLAKFSMTIAFQDGTSAIWPTSGVYLAAVLLLGYRIYPALLLSELITNFLFFYKNPLTCSIISLCGISDPLIIGLLINCFIKHRNILERVQDVFKFMVLIVPYPAISTTFVTCVLCLSGYTPWAEYGNVWRSWFIGVIAGIIIEDTGVGMNPEQIEKIFLPFEQVGSTEKQAEGTGLGLAISQKILALMGGTINVKSQLGVGSNFWFEVDLAQAKEWMLNPNDVQKKSIIGFQGEKRKILIVDDSWENRSVVLNLLEPIGFELCEACNGQQGLDQTVEFQPDLIITDLVMPVMDGFAMIQNLRSSPEFPKMVIIASSASVFEVDRHKAIEAGCNDFLTKPVQIANLLEQLQHYLQLTWIYQNENGLTRKIQEASTNATEVVFPPSSELVALTLATQRCNIGDIQAEIKRIQQLDTKYTAFAEQVLALTDEFEMEAIAELIKTHIPNK